MLETRLENRTHPAIRKYNRRMVGRISSSRTIGVVSALALVASGCGSDDGQSDATREAERVELGPPPSAPGAQATITPPSEPQCSSSAEPGRCAGAAALPDCLSEGCAAPPMLDPWSCPSGWDTEVLALPTGIDVPICSAPATPSCESGHAAFAGESLCTPLGGPCTATEFPSADDLQNLTPGFSGSVIYVAAGGTGDGSLANPFGSLDEALGQATDGDVVALGKGTFDTNLEVDRRVAVVGTCVEGTAIAPADPSLSTLSIATGGVFLARLRIHGGLTGVSVLPGAEAKLNLVEIISATRGAVLLETGSTATLERVLLRPTAGPLGTPEEGAGLVVDGGLANLTDVVVHRARGAGVLVQGNDASIDAVRLTVLNTLPRLDDKQEGSGVTVRSGATASIAASILSKNRVAAVLAQEGADVTLTDVALRETLARFADLKAGHGVKAETGAHVHGTRLLIDQNQTSGVIASGSGTVVELTSVAVRDTQSQIADDTAGRGVESWSGARVVVRQAWVRGNRAMGLTAAGSGAELEAHDVFVLDTEFEEATKYFGRGFWVTGGGAGRATRAWFENNRSIGAGVVKPGSSLELTDVEIRGTRPRELDDTYGRGIEVWGGASLTALRTSLRDNHAIGVFAADEGTAVTLDQTLIEGTLPRASDDVGGYGIAAWSGVQVTVSASLLTGNHAAGVWVADMGSSATMHDVVVQDTEAEADDGLWGAGWVVTDGASLQGARLRSSANRMVGLLATDPETSVNLEDLTVHDTREPAVFEDVAPAYGVAVMAGAQLVVSRGDLYANATAGLVAGTDATVTAADVLIHDTRSDAEAMLGGEGLVATPGSVVSLQRAVLAGNRSTAVAAYGQETVVTLDDVVMRDTSSPSCAELEPSHPKSCVTNATIESPSAAVWMDAGATVTLRRFDAAGSACGLFVGPEGWLDAAQGVVHDNCIGANVRNPSLGLEAVRGETVRYVDNGTNLDSVSIDVPRLGDVGLPSF